MTTWTYRGSFRSCPKDTKSMCTIANFLSGTWKGRKAKRGRLLFSWQQIGQYLWNCSTFAGKPFQKYLSLHKRLVSLLPGCIWQCANLKADLHCEAGNKNLAGCFLAQYVHGGIEVISSFSKCKFSFESLSSSCTESAFACAKCSSCSLWLVKIFWSWGKV